VDTFERSRLEWSEIQKAPHAGVLRLHQRLLGLRATGAAFRAASRDDFDARALDADTVVVERRSGDERVWAIVRLSGSGAATIDGVRDSHVMLTTEDGDVTSDPQPIDVRMSGDKAEVKFSRPGAVLLRGSCFAP
jgi:maltooligosyltrehalose trehalohydrolase